MAKVLDYLSTPTPATGPPAPAPITAEDFKALSSDERAALGTSTSLDLLSSYAHDCLALLTDAQLKFLVLRSAAATPALPIVPPIPALSPRMTAVLASTNPSGSSYFGLLDFLDSQSSFDATFPRPTPLLGTPFTSGASIDSTSLLSTLNRFLDSCKFHLFVPIF